MIWSQPQPSSTLHKYKIENIIITFILQAQASVPEQIEDNLKIQDDNTKNKATDGVEFQTEKVSYSAVKVTDDLNTEEYDAVSNSKVTLKRCHSPEPTTSKDDKSILKKVKVKEEPSDHDIKPGTSASISNNDNSAVRINNCLIKLSSPKSFILYFI